jgi:hypothetical protein
MTIDEVTQQVKETNEVFLQSTPEQKRVMIAQDVLDRITAKQITPDRGYGLAQFYMKIDDCSSSDQILANRSMRTKGAKSIKTSLDEHGLKCDVCAKGGLFVAYIGRVNEFTWEMYQNNSNPDSYPVQKLFELFDQKQLALIENCFEEGTITDTDTEGYIMFTDDERHIYNRYSTIENLESPTELLQSICVNIIQNNGYFILPGISLDYPKTPENKNPYWIDSKAPDNTSERFTSRL